MTGTKDSPTLPNLPSNAEITRFDGTNKGIEFICAQMFFKHMPFDLFTET
jgi:hypothetical protein